MSSVRWYCSSKGQVHLHRDLRDGHQERGQQVGIPELIHARQQGHSAVPDIASMVYEAVAHLHLCILQPRGGVGV